MTRLTHTTYKRQHHQLRREWRDRHGYAFTMLSPTEQILIHDFYEPSKRLMGADLKAHRAVITTARLSLPQQAGKAFARIEPFLDRPPLVPVPVPMRAGHSKRRQAAVTITSKTHAHIDPARIAKILMDMARESRERNDRAA